MSKYNDFMSHIRVDDAMHRRIMDAVSGAIEQGAEITPLNSKEEDRVKTPIKRKAKVSVIKIISIAAAAILVAGGAVMLSTTMMSSSTKQMNTVAQEEKTDQLDSALAVSNGNRTFAGNKKSGSHYGDAPDGASDRNKVTVKGAVGSTKNAAANDKTVESIEGIPGKENEDEETQAAAPGEGKGDIKDRLPFKVKAVGSGSLKDNIGMTVYTGEDGEKMILFTAKEGTDIVKAYYPDFEGVPALLQTEAGQVFKAVDTSAGRNVVVKNAGPFDAVTWTKDGTSYMLAFSSKKDTNVFISLMEII